MSPTQDSLAMGMNLIFPWLYLSHSCNWAERKVQYNA